MFKNVMMYRLLSPWDQVQATLEAALEDGRFAECGASQEKSVGWVPPREQEHLSLIHI